MKNYWNLALITSILIHTAVLTGLPSLPHRDILLKKEKQPKTVIKMMPEKIEKIIKRKQNLKEMKNPPPFVDNFMNRLMPGKRASYSLDKPKIVAKATKIVTLSEIPRDENLKKIPAYMDYYRFIREKIRETAFSCYTSRAQGEVFVSFVILSNGQIETLSMGRESDAESSLQKIAIQSVKGAAPFPPFPPELKDYERLHFNISIYFKNN
ncbi:MAG: TonB family protein [Candidatus Omnitrophota bacterium]|nr:MAG: TonB family protein [Candidatus Omnitrophota bacterium]